MSDAVYRSRAAAEWFVASRERGGSTFSRISPTGEARPERQQPVVEYRIVTVEELAREGVYALARALLVLMTSDHEWLISTEIGSEAKIELFADLRSGKVES